MIEYHLLKKADLTTNVSPRTFPPGCSIEIINTSVLTEISGKELSISDREHVTSYLYQHAEDFNLENFINKAGDESGVHLTLDTSDDYERLNEIAKKIEIDTPLAEVLNIAKMLKKGPDNE